MLHLHSERLAALADDEPTVVEAQHLAGCPQCADSRRFHQNLLLAARRHGAQPETPLTNWNSLAPRLAGAGLIAAPVIKKRSAPGIMRRVAMLAASLALLAAGTAAGRMSAGAPVIPASLSPLASNSQPDSPEFSSTGEALNVFLTAQRDYQRAAAYLAAHDESSRDSERAVLTRLAALEDMHAASVAALREAPTDPVLNSYYVSTLNAREATRQQITQMVPVGMRSKGY